MLRAKIPVFVALWFATLLPHVLTMKAPNLPAGLLIYVLVFVAIPSASVGWYYLIDGREPFNGFSLLKGYLFLSFVLILFLNKIDLVPQLSMVLTRARRAGDWNLQSTFSSILRSFYGCTISASAPACFRWICAPIERVLTSYRSTT